MPGHLWREWKKMPTGAEKGFQISHWIPWWNSAAARGKGRESARWRSKRFVAVKKVEMQWKESYGLREKFSRAITFYTSCFKVDSTPSTGFKLWGAWWFRKDASGTILSTRDSIIVCLHKEGLEGQGVEGWKKYVFLCKISLEKKGVSVVCMLVYFGL